jgi:hypothetical protein
VVLETRNESCRPLAPLLVRSRSSFNGLFFADSSFVEQARIWHACGARHLGDAVINCLAAWDTNAKVSIVKGKRTGRVEPPNEVTASGRPAAVGSYARSSS